MIDFEEKRGRGEFQFWNKSDDITDTLTTSYDEATGAMRQLTQHLLPIKTKVEDASVESKPLESDEITAIPAPTLDASNPATDTKATTDGNANPTQTSLNPPPPPPENALPTYDWSNVEFDIIEEASKSPLDGAIAAAIAMAGTENKIKTATMSILLIGGTSALKGLGAFVSERLPPLLRAKNIPLDHVSIVPPPRGLNPRFVSWKGASVICNLESLSDMWIRRDEWEAIGARSLKDRCLFI